MERNNVTHKVLLKLLNVFSGPFSIYKLSPRLEEIFERNDILIAMSELDSTHTSKYTPPRLVPLLQKAKDAYFLWYTYYQTIPKVHRRSLGQRIDTLFVEIIEATATASFLGREEKLPYVRFSIRKVDTLKILLLVLWETKSLDNKKYIALSVKIDEIGRMLGGWSGQLQKQNSPFTGEK